jgi:hypothetical protein
MRIAPPSDRPRSVKIAVRCMAVALALGVAILIGWDVPKITAATVVIIGGLIWAVAWRQNWARWTLAAVTISSLVFTWGIIRFQLSYGTLLPIATAAQLILEALGLFLLFRPEAGRWYRRTPGGVD